jgi:hypothetical protein
VQADAPQRRVDGEKPGVWGECRRLLGHSVRLMGGCWAVPRSLQNGG